MNKAFSYLLTVNDSMFLGLRILISVNGLNSKLEAISNHSVKSYTTSASIKKVL